MTEQNDYSAPDLELLADWKLIEDYLNVLEGRESVQLAAPTPDQVEIVRRWRNVFDDEMQMVRTVRQLLLYGRRMMSGKTIEEAAHAARRFIEILQSGLLDPQIPTLVMPEPNNNE